MGQRIYWPRGKVLGGSSSLNGMAYVWGDPTEYDSWERRGIKGWNFSDLAPYFKKLESNVHATKEFRGKSIGTTAVKVLTNFGFETMGWNRIEAMIDHDNEASKKVVTRAGYEHEGLLRQRVVRDDGSIIDMDVFAVLQSNWKGLP